MSKRAATPAGRLVILGACLAASLMSPAPAAAATKAETRGKAFVTLHCSKCHATGRTGASPVKEAPPLRDLSKRYPLENLEEAFAEGVVVNHGSTTMPSFRLEPQSISDMIAYLKSIGRK
jgi:cytochrome c